MPGLVGFGGAPTSANSKELLAAMAGALMAEECYQVDLVPGPDFGLGCVSLGPPDSHSLPVWNEEASLCLVMAGEIYETRELKQELLGKGYRFQLGSHAELLLHLFEEFGPAFASHLN